MVQTQDTRQGGAEVAEHCEWVNAWAEQRRASSVIAPALSGQTPANVVPIRWGEPAGADTAAAALATRADPAQQFERDLAEIASARDALLAAAPDATAGKMPARVVWLPFALRRTTDSVPILLGTVLGFLMLLVFGVAAVFAKLAR